MITQENIKHSQLLKMERIKLNYGELKVVQTYIIIVLLQLIMVDMVDILLEIFHYILEINYMFM
jgi:hypothetical protein